MSDKSFKVFKKTLFYESGLYVSDILKNNPKTRISVYNDGKISKIIIPDIKGVATRLDEFSGNKEEILHTIAKYKLDSESSKTRPRIILDIPENTNFYRIIADICDGGNPYSEADFLEADGGTIYYCNTGVILGEQNIEIPMSDLINRMTQVGLNGYFRDYITDGKILREMYAANLRRQSHEP